MEKISRAQLKLLRSLNRKKARRESGRFFVEGVRACEALVNSDCPAETLVVTPSARKDDRVRILLDGASGTAVVECTDSEMGSISDVVTSQGLLAVAAWTDRALGDLLNATWGLVVALETVRDPANVGTIVRAADWFGADAVMLGEGCAELLNPKAVRATAGSLFHVPVWRNVPMASTLGTLRARGHRIVGASTDGAPCEHGWHHGHDILVLGNEARGLSETALSEVQERLRIQGAGRAESLNVAMAAVALLALARA